MLARAAVLRLALALVAALVAGGGGAASVTIQDRFADQIAALSEPGGYFDTDNLISNERSYLSVLPNLRAARVRGGAYLGVGPDQSFSYIAEIRPAIAFIVDIRRDNLLLHLLFKALFAESRTRADYLLQLCGRPVPAALGSWPSQSISRIVELVDRTAPTEASLADLRGRLSRRVSSFGVPLSADDRSTIERFHRRFIDDGLDLQFNSTGRSPQASYPTLRDLVLETDSTGRQAGFLAQEEAFQFVKALQAADHVIPVVGDLSGPTALRAIGRFLSAQRIAVSAFYTSNVEFYLSRNGAFSRFEENVRQLPWADHGVIIRSHFGGGSSMSELEPASRFLKRR